MIIRKFLIKEFYYDKINEGLYQKQYFNNKQKR
jgi:hypothetical protein